MTVRNGYVAYYMCARKIRYDSYQGAEDHIERWKHDKGYSLQPYLCPECGGFHVGHPVTKQRKRPKVVRMAGPPSVIPDRETVLSERIRRRMERGRTHRNMGKPQCDVIMCGRGGPHRCGQTGVYDVDGEHLVCTYHWTQARGAIAFTEEDAREFRRTRKKVQQRLEIVQ